MAQWVLGALAPVFLATPTMVLLIHLPRHPVEGRLRDQLAPLIGQDQNRALGVGSTIVQTGLVPRQRWQTRALTSRISHTLRCWDPAIMVPSIKPMA